MSSAVRQLRLVTEPAPAHGTTKDPARRVFEHWVYFFDKDPKRCKLDGVDTERRKVINAAIAAYGEELILQVVEGVAAAPMDGPGVTPSMRDAMREIAWFLAKTVRIERALGHYDKLMAAMADAPVCEPLRVGAEISAEELAARSHAALVARAELKARAAALRAAHG